MRNETLVRLAWSPFLDGRFSLLAGTVCLHKNTLARPDGSTSSRRDNRELQIRRRGRLRRRDFLNTKQCSLLNRRHFGGENVTAVIILLRVLAKMSQWRKQVIKCQNFYHLAIWSGLNLRINLYGEKEHNEAFRSVLFLENTRKNLKLNVVVVLVPETKGLL